MIKFYNRRHKYIKENGCGTDFFRTQSVCSFVYRHIWIFLVPTTLLEADKMLYDAKELTLDFRALLSPWSLPR